MNAPLAKDIWAGIELELAQAATNHSDLRPAGLSFADAVERLPRLLDAIEDGAKRIDKIVTGLKTYSRQSPADTRELINISDAIESAATLTASRIREASEQFAVTVAPELPRIIGDRQRLEQVLINLILNACDAMPDTDGRIEIHADSDTAEGMVGITVSDNGVGIPSDQLAHVTDPFFTTKRDQGGTGLGLSIATGIVSDFGGQIKIESRLGQGTTVRLLLPFGSLHRE
jgi:polar amino acid transport system substrate-binding protein